jgi:hypothetical protein
MKKLFVVFVMVVSLMMLDVACAAENNTAEKPAETVETITESKAESKAESKVEAETESKVESEAESVTEETEEEKKVWTKDMEVVFYMPGIKQVFSWDEETGWIKMERYDSDGELGLNTNEYLYISMAFKANADALFPELEEFYPKTDLLKKTYTVETYDDLITYTNGEEYYEIHLIPPEDAVIEKKDSKDGAVLEQYTGSEAAELIHKFIDTYIIDEETEAIIAADEEAYLEALRARRAAEKND